MCAHFILIPKDELEDIIEDIKNHLKAEQADILHSYRSVYPKAQMPVVVSNADQLAIRTMQWGYPVTWQKDVIFNTKMETALSSRPNMWYDSIRHRRCLIPSFGFFEPHKKDTHPSLLTGKPVKDQYYFRMPDTDMVWMAGIYREDSFSVMTTAPNQWVATIHPRMPVVLHTDELSRWLYEDYAALAKRDAIRLESFKVAS
jgi:putative SOS response-associated peptidase YedK